MIEIPLTLDFVDPFRSVGHLRCLGWMQGSNGDLGMMAIYVTTIIDASTLAARARSSPDAAVLRRLVGSKSIGYPSSEEPGLVGNSIEGLVMLSARYAFRSVQTF